MVQANDEGEALKGALLNAIQLPLIADMARKAVEDLLYEIAADAELSRKYQVALNKK
jgi:hypothetical protein